MLERYHEAIGDPELLELADDIGLVDVRMLEIVEALDDRAPEDLWHELRGRWAALVGADEKRRRAETDKEKQAADRGLTDAISYVGRLIERGATETQNWNEIFKLQGHRAKLVESQRKREMELGQYINAAQMQAYTVALVEIIRRYVSDRDALQNIAEAVRLLNAGKPG